MQPRTHWTKTLLIDSLQTQMKRKCERMAACRPVFEVAESFFLAWLARYPKDEFDGEEHAVIGELSVGARESPWDEETAWVSVYVGLYYCDNFPGFAHAAWAWLLRHDPNNLRYAIQACQYVDWSSGSSGWPALRLMIKRHLRPEDTLPILRESGVANLLET